MFDILDLLIHDKSQFIVLHRYSIEIKFNYISSCRERRIGFAATAPRSEAPPGPRAVFCQQNGLRRCPLVGEDCSWIESREN